MVFKNRKLDMLLIGAMVVALAVPLINVFIIYPQFSKLLTDDREDSAIRLTKHLENELRINEIRFPTIEGEDISPKSKLLLDGYLADFDLRKMKIFSTNGVTVYSTDKRDIGIVNDNSYFFEKVAKGQIFSKVVKKHTNSLEGQIYEDDVVEVYVPALENNKFAGAFELYYNITSQVASLEKHFVYASILPFAVSGILLFALYWGFLNLDKSLIEQEKAKKKIKTLEGIIPICMHCKEIRDDKGAWNRLEKYIMEHSEAEFSHGLCDKCLEEKYGEEMSN